MPLGTPNVKGNHLNLEDNASKQSPAPEPTVGDHDPLAGTAGLSLGAQLSPSDNTPPAAPESTYTKPVWTPPRGFSSPDQSAGFAGGGHAPRNASPEEPLDRKRVALDKLEQSRTRLLKELRKVIIGQDKIIEELMMVLFAGGHCLISGAPGLAKTLLIRTLANIVDLQFKRVQFTPDLMPSDLTGTEIIDENRVSGHRELRFIKGPLFTNVLLADEINRTPPKTQAALLESMEEKQVSVAGETHPLPQPFYVFATQNPIEMEGTYPLPEAQMDRFMFKLMIDYLAEDEELAVATQTTSGARQQVEALFSAEDMLTFAELVRQVPIAEPIARYAVRLVQRTRPDHPDAPDFVKKWVSWGAGTRASQYVILGAKSRALLKGRFHVACEDIRAVAYPALRHRILTNFQADADHVDSETIIDRLLELVPEPKSGLL